MVAVSAPALTAEISRPEAVKPARWLANPRFDVTFVGATAGLALIVGLAMGMQSSLFGLVLLFDTWLLGYHHVIGTFTRIAFDTESFQRYRHLVTWLPPLVLAGVLAVTFGIGEWALATTYLYWQSWHYTRQSYGVAQMYRVKAGVPGNSLNEMKAVIYALPLAGILHRSYQSPDRFLGMDLKVVPVPAIAVEIAAVVAVGAVAWWAIRQLIAWRQGSLAVAYNAYLLSHVAVFTAGYFLLQNINHGWLVINVWHNSQYLLVVWMYNNKRFKNQVDPNHRFLSTLSQKHYIVRFFATTLVVSVGAYVLLWAGIAAFSFSALPLALIFAQTINFHHYIVDSVVWKVRKPQMRSDLGLAQAA